MQNPEIESIGVIYYDGSEEAFPLERGGLILVTDSTDAFESMVGKDKDGNVVTTFFDFEQTPQEAYTAVDSQDLLKITPGMTFREVQELLGFQKENLPTWYYSITYLVDEDYVYSFGMMEKETDPIGIGGEEIYNGFLRKKSAVDHYVSYVAEKGILKKDGSRFQPLDVIHYIDYGIYQSAHVFTIQISELLIAGNTMTTLGKETPVTFKRASTDILSPTGIYCLKDGEIFTLEEAYENGVLTNEDLVRIEERQWTALAQ